MSMCAWPSLNAPASKKRFAASSCASAERGASASARAMCSAASAESPLWSKTDASAMMGSGRRGAAACARSATSRASESETARCESTPICRPSAEAYAASTTGSFGARSLASRRSSSARAVASAVKRKYSRRPRRKRSSTSGSRSTRSTFGKERPIASVIPRAASSVKRSMSLRLPRKYWCQIWNPSSTVVSRTCATNPPSLRRSVPCATTSAPKRRPLARASALDARICDVTPRGYTESPGTADTASMSPSANPQPRCSHSGRAITSSGKIASVGSPRAGFRTIDRDGGELAFTECNRRSSAPTACTEGKRSSRARARQRMTIFASASGISGRRFRASGGGSIVRLTIGMSAGPGNGSWPVSISKIIVPMAYWSARPSKSDAPWACSGDMYPGVPKTSPARSLESPRPLATPKSMTTTRPSGAIATLSGLRSK